MIRGTVIAPHHPDYDATRMVALAQFDRRPAAIVRVANAADIAAVLNFARATDLQFSSDQAALLQQLALPTAPSSSTSRPQHIDINIIIFFPLSGNKA